MKTEKGQNLRIHKTQLKFFQIMSLCYYMTCYTRCIVEINIHINNMKIYKGLKAIKNKDCAFSITACDPFAFKLLIN